MTIKWDGHSHTKFCKHGHPDELDRYLDRAVELGFERYSVTEHPPLPDRWIDDAPLMAELAMGFEEMPAYFAYVREAKKRYEGRLDVTVGLEIDYLHDRFAFTERIVDPWADALEDIVVSVHYLPGRGGMRCIDYKPDDFKTNLLDYYGSMEQVVDAYFDHVELAIETAARLPGRKRIGHLGLIGKFRQALPPIDEGQMRERLEKALPLLVRANVGVDVNTAGLRVATCGVAYVPEWLIRACVDAGVECVYGSDSHKPEQVGFGWDYFERAMRREAKPGSRNP
ncbi:histidinol-phosphatase HisJ [Paenibacillus flagellatus]|uniref:Histidinol-phosphatase n=1 Tax=Paenibacillus flagellatus TaxID=2211139 RepID=A0A2V5JVG6_9BACL|nr:histidinol-phosphatase HisJ [Paenibacillus flagellatus]PYI50588.1 histidinol-phosphatase [Paenibacillus flagellatus]